jgi:hypothetical protein
LTPAFVWGLFASFQGLMRFGVSDTEQTPEICAPAASTRVQLIKIFLRYVDQHPEIVHQEFENVALVALRQAFPCPK